MEEKHHRREASEVTRVIVFVEGQSEEAFVTQVLYDYFMRSGIYLTPIIATTSPGHKGGIVNYQKVRNQLGKIRKQDKNAWITTLIDFYRYPKDSPGRSDPSYHALNNCYDKVTYLEQAMKDDLSISNFIPFLMLHEFEALLFCDTDVISDWIDNVDDSALKKISEQFPSPEYINEGEHTAPSKRIEKHAPKYKKTLHGPMIAEVIGIDTFRRKSPHFDAWIGSILDLAR